jgi:hypothetical protein
MMPRNRWETREKFGRAWVSGGGLADC